MTFIPSAIEEQISSAKFGEEYFKPMAFSYEYRAHAFESMENNKPYLSISKYFKRVGTADTWYPTHLAIDLPLNNWEKFVKMYRKCRKLRKRACGVIGIDLIFFILNSLWCKIT